MITTNKSEKNLDNYKLVGAEMRLLKEVVMRTYLDAYAILPANERKKLQRAIVTIDEVCSHTDDCMFAEHPDIGHDYTAVFYGNFQTASRSEVDAEVTRLARSVVSKILPF